MGKFLFLFLVVFTAQASQQQNTLISEAQYKAIGEKVAALYEPRIKKEGNHLVLKLEWNQTKMAYPNNLVPEYQMYEIAVTGDYARTPGLTPDGFSLIVCHEFAHLFGGAPYAFSYRLTHEAQSDYYSTLRCFKEYAAHDDNKAIVASLGERVTPEMRAQCKQVYREGSKDFYVCARGMAASYNVVSTRNPETQVSISKKDPAKVESHIFDYYGSPQCRLDSLVAGLLCDAKGKVSNTDYRKGTCTAESGHKIGLRPECSFNPAVQKAFENRIEN